MLPPRGRLRPLRTPWTGQEKVRYSRHRPGLTASHPDRSSSAGDTRSSIMSSRCSPTIATHDYPTSANGSLRGGVGEELRPQDFRTSWTCSSTSPRQGGRWGRWPTGGVVHFPAPGGGAAGPGAGRGVQFHLTNPGLGVDAPAALIRAVGEELRSAAHPLLHRPLHRPVPLCASQGDARGARLTYMAGACGVHPEPTRRQMTTTTGPGNPGKARGMRRQPCRT